jgi:hypothetical protein
VAKNTLDLAIDSEIMRKAGKLLIWRSRGASGGVAWVKI